MENIAPLAKVLAEANGLDWKGIKGTGAGGQITEDDVLGHLALIMSGEVEPPSTPVDPEPSPAELAAAASPELLSRAGVDSDLTDLLKMQEDARAAMKAQAATPAASTASSDDFELEDEPAAQHEEAPLAAQPAPEVAAPESATTIGQPAAAAGVAGAGAVMGGLLSSLYHKSDNAPQAAPAEPAAPMPAASSTPAFNLSGLPGAAQSQDSQSSEPAYSAPSYTESEVHVPPVSAWAAPAHEAAPAQESSHQSSAQQDYQQPAYQEPAYQEPTYQEPAYQEPAQEPDSQESHQEAAYQQPSSQPSYQQSYAAPATSSDWKGVYLRRDADISAAEEARTQLAEVLGSFPLSVLVARAAQKSAASLGLSSVALANTSGEALNADLSGDLRGSLSGMHDAATGAQADLLVVNAGEFDLDDLHFPHAITLSVGRVEGGKAALSLNGQVDPAQGARFLADVAALLATPVKLLV